MFQFLLIDLSSISTFVRPGFDDGRSGGEGCFSLLWNAIRMAGNKRMSANMASKTAPVVNRPKFNKYFKDYEIIQLLNMFDDFAILVDVHSNLDLCRDKKDNFLLNLAKDSKSDYLITGDQDLLILERIDNCKIIQYSNFLKEMN